MKLTTFSYDISNNNWYTGVEVVKATSNTYFHLLNKIDRFAIISKLNELIQIDTHELLDDHIIEINDYLDESYYDLNIVLNQATVNNLKELYMDMYYNLHNVLPDIELLGNKILAVRGE